MKTIVSVFSVIFGIVQAFFAVSANAAPNDPDTPASVKGVTILSADQAKGMMSDARFYDLRKALNFGKGHVPGAVQLPVKWASENVPDADLSKDEMDLGKLPGDKNGKVVFYSDSARGWKAYKASQIAAKAGYKNVFWMRGGFAEWESRGYSVEK